MKKLLIILSILALIFISCQETRNIYAVIYESGSCLENDYEVEEVFFTYSKEIALKEAEFGERVEIIKLGTNMLEEYLYILEEYNENTCRSDFRIIEITEETKRLDYIILDKNNLQKL